MDMRSGVSSAPLSAEDRVDGWKGIAQHLHRDARTAQRWETEGLPIYRHHHSKHGSVYAYKSEIDSWWKSRPPTASKQKRIASKGIAARFSSFGTRNIRLAMCFVIALIIGFAGFEAYHFFVRRKQAASTRIAAAKQVTAVVLPFEDVSSGKAKSELGKDFTDKVIRELEHSTPIRVVQASSDAPGENNLQQLSEFAESLHATEILGGSIRQYGHRVHVTAELINPATRNITWTTEFDRDPEDLRAFEARVAHAIAAGLDNALFSCGGQ